jgi:hypothetical protein
MLEAQQKKASRQSAGPGRSIEVFGTDRDLLDNSAGFSPVCQQLPAHSNVLGWVLPYEYSDVLDAIHFNRCLGKLFDQLSLLLNADRRSFYHDRWHLGSTPLTTRIVLDPIARQA